MIKKRRLGAEPKIIQKWSQRGVEKGTLTDPEMDPNGAQKGAKRNHVGDVFGPKRPSEPERRIFTEY